MGTFHTIFFFLLPLPLIILSALAPYPSLIINILFGLVLFKWWGRKLALGFVLGAALFSWVAGWLIHNSFKASRVILIGIILGTLGTGLFFLTFGYSYLSEWGKNFNQAINDSISYYREHGVGEEKLMLLRETMDQFSRILRVGLPAIIVIGVTILISFNLFLARRFLINLRYRELPLLPPSQWKIPDNFIWVFIGAGFLILAGKAFAAESFYRVGLNFMILMLAAYLIQGFILVNFFLKKWNWPVFLRLLLYLLLVFQPLVLAMVILWGIFEVWFDFRKLEVAGPQ